MANRNWANKGNMYMMEVKPVLVSCNFIVDSSNGNGLGIRSLKGPGVKAVYMHTSSTPAAGNPNPEAGVIVVQFQDNYNRYLGGFSGQVTPIGTPVTATTNHNPAVVISLGTSTQAQWLAVGFPAIYLNPSTGLPNVGACFIPTSSATIGGSATVAPPATAGSGIDHIEVIGDANQTISSSQQSSQGAQTIMQCMFEGALTAPANNSVIGLSFLMSDSSVFVQGE